jgi:hypothetical protein
LPEIHTEIAAFNFSVKRWSICSATLGCYVSGKGNIAPAETDIEGKAANWKVDTSYLPKFFARRLSRLSKMAIYVSYHCLFDGNTFLHMPSVFCSRYGEFINTCSVIDAIYQKTPVSPMDFSHAVYNTSQGLCSILTKDTSPSIMISATEDMIENGWLKAIAMLEQGEENVLLVYHEDSLHNDYDTLIKDNIHPLAFACVLTKNDGNMNGRLTLSTHTCQTSKSVSNLSDNQHAISLASILALGQGNTSLTTSRLHWDWSFASDA